METCRHGHSETALMLIEQKADVHAQAKKGWTSLIEAAASGLNLVVMVLVGKGADINRKNNFGCTALMEAILHEHQVIVSQLQPKMLTHDIDQSHPVPCAVPNQKS